MSALKLHTAATKRPTLVEPSCPVDVPLTTAQRIMLPMYENITLALQSGGALDSYQAGVLEGLDEAGIVPNRIASTSIGALNTTIIAGNAPEHWQTKLCEFWQIITQPTFSLPLSDIPENTWLDSSAYLCK